MAEPLQMRLISTDAGCQPRALPDAATVSEYADAMRAGAEFPPVVVFHDGTAHYLADGYHRYGAVAKLKRAEILADIRQGSLRDAILFSLSANQSHGLRRTNGDKRRAVSRIFQDEEWSRWTDRRVADHCGVSHTFVAELRKELGIDQIGNGCQLPREAKGGRSYPASRAPRISRGVIADRDVAQEMPPDDEPTRQIADEHDPNTGEIIAQAPAQAGDTGLDDAEAIHCPRDGAGQLGSPVSGREVEDSVHTIPNSFSLAIHRSDSGIWLITSPSPELDGLLIAQEDLAEGFSEVVEAIVGLIRASASIVERVA